MNSVATILRERERKGLITRNAVRIVLSLFYLPSAFLLGTGNKTEELLTGAFLVVTCLLAGLHPSTEIASTYSEGYLTGKLHPDMEIFKLLLLSSIIGIVYFSAGKTHALVQEPAARVRLKGKEEIIRLYTAYPAAD